ncbi:MAG: hypothetical protein AAFV85_24810 [Cyanobacteria bacterium J06634_6]
MTKLKDACFSARYLIKIYAASQEVQPEVLSTGLSQNINIQDLQWLIRQFEFQDMSRLPTIDVRSRLALAGAWSRYVPEVNAIYFAEDFVRETPKRELLTTVLREIINAVRQLER